MGRESGRAKTRQERENGMELPQYTGNLVGDKSSAENFKLILHSALCNSTIETFIETFSVEYYLF